MPLGLLGLGHLQAGRGRAHDERGHATQCRERQQPSRLTNRWLWIRRGEGGRWKRNCQEAAAPPSQTVHSSTEIVNLNLSALLPSLLSGLSKQPTLTPSQWRPRRCQAASIEQAAESLRAMRAKRPVTCRLSADYDNESSLHCAHCAPSSGSLRSSRCPHGSQKRDRRVGHRANTHLRQTTLWAVWAVCRYMLRMSSLASTCAQEDP